MPFLVALLVIALIIAFLFLSTLFIVPQQQAYIIERFGKFNKVQFAGIHIRIPFVDRIAMKTNCASTSSTCSWRPKPSTMCSSRSSPPPSSV